MKLAAYQYKLIHKPGRDLGPADALSRLPLSVILEQVTTPADIFMLEDVYPGALCAAKVGQATKRDPELSQVVQAVSKGETFPQLPVYSAYNTKSAELSLHEGCLLWGSRVVVPRELRNKVLQLPHAGHPGTEKAKMIARSHVWCPGTDGDITNLVRSCQVFQIHQRALRRLPMTLWPVPERPWSHLHVDLADHFRVIPLLSKWTPFRNGRKSSPRPLLRPKRQLRPFGRCFLLKDCQISSCLTR